MKIKDLPIDIQEIHDVSEPSSFMDFNATNTNNVIWTR